jgi:hypothetical protein
VGRKGFKIQCKWVAVREYLGGEKYKGENQENRKR